MAPGYSYRLIRPNNEIDKVIKNDKEDLELYINKNDLKRKSPFMEFLNKIKFIFTKAK